MRSPVNTAIDPALKPARLRLAASGVCSGLLNRRFTSPSGTGKPFATTQDQPTRAAIHAEAAASSWFESLTPSQT